jgi:formylglycine-generating enzyme required for sulfatase activity
MAAAAATLSLDREALAAWYRRNRERSAHLFGLIDPKAYYSRPIPLRHPFAFYEGHLPAFSFLVVNRRALGEASVDARLEKLFERGIDPSTIDSARAHDRADWPAREQIEAFGQRCDQRLYEAIATAKLVDDGVPHLVRGQAIFTALEHEQMHHETLVYIIHQLPRELKGRFRQTHHDTQPPVNAFVEIPGGTVTLGARRDAITFGWDNEFDAHDVHVERFAVQQYPVSNGEYLEFVRAGGKLPPFWLERDGELHLRGVFEELPLPLSWPVYVSNDEARAYAAWKGARLMTEAEYQRASYGSPDDQPRRYPWGADEPTTLHGNFDFERFDPDPVNAHPAGASAWGVYDMVGNGWEWTSTPFAPFPGFEPMASYPQYSADFFDGRHYVMKGASPVTARELIRPSFRNWFYADYPYAYGKFRCAE